MSSTVDKLRAAGLSDKQIMHLLDCAQMWNHSFRVMAAALLSYQETGSPFAKLEEYTAPQIEAVPRNRAERRKKDARRKNKD